MMLFAKRGATSYADLKVVQSVACLIMRHRTAKHSLELEEKLRGTRRPTNAREWLALRYRADRTGQALRR